MTRKLLAGLLAGLCVLSVTLIPGLEARALPSEFRQDGVLVNQQFSAYITVTIENNSLTSPYNVIVRDVNDDGLIVFDGLLGPKETAVIELRTSETGKYGEIEYTRDGGGVWTTKAFIEDNDKVSLLL